MYRLWYLPGFLYILYILCALLCHPATGLNTTQLKEQTLEMFHHAYWSYMNNAYPADELMPLSCAGRFRGVTPCRGDVDDALGNFSLTLVDSLDTLVVVGDYDEFERASELIVKNVKLDSDLEVSVFETNIRMVGGLLSGHLMAKLLQHKQPHRMTWYTEQMLQMAKEMADILLPAFNTTSGVPYPRVNLKYGIVDRLKHNQDTCTACGGTMILEFAALTRLTGDPIYEEKARKAMDFLWEQRHRSSDLMGTILNVHNGDWVRRDSGIGAGIDSYYEYCLKAYVLLGDELFLDRFNKHYEAVMKYIIRGPLFFDVHMHRPTITSRPFMDSLLAFWPGLQVLKGDIKPAIETHEMLYQVMLKHNFLPEAFTHDFHVHWGQHPLRPEFVESTYFLYRATKDPHYLQVAQQILNSLQNHVRVPCGFAGIKDVRTMAHEDRMDSFVLSETFKYLYMIFADENELLFDPDSYIFTTEAHLLPLSIASINRADAPVPSLRVNKMNTEDPSFSRSCPNTQYLFSGEMTTFVRRVRTPLKNLVTAAPRRGQKQRGGSCSAKSERNGRLRAHEFSANDNGHIELLRLMGIQVVTQTDGRVQLSHSASLANSPDDAEEGLIFMQEMILLSHRQETEAVHPPRVLQIVSYPFFGKLSFVASPALFGAEIKDLNGIDGKFALAYPVRACVPLHNHQQVKGRIALVERSDCMFQEKVRFAQLAGAVGVIVGDNYKDTTADSSPLFAMSGDGKSDVNIASVFLFEKETQDLLLLWALNPNMKIRIGAIIINPRIYFVNYLKSFAITPTFPTCAIGSGPQIHRTITIQSNGKDTTCVTEGDNVICMEHEGDDDVFSIVSMDVEASNDPDRQSSFSNPLRRAMEKAKEFAKVKSSVKPPKSDIIRVVTGSTGRKELKFDLGNLIPPKGVSTKNDKNKLIEEFYQRMIEETNIDDLAKRNKYLESAAKMVLITLGERIELSKDEEELFTELGDNIKLKRLAKTKEDNIECSEDEDGNIRCNAVKP